MFLVKKLEVIDFRKFCAGGSPEYIKAKKILDDLRKPKETNFTVYSLVINPLSFFDVHFFLIGSTVVLLAILEKGIAQTGMVNLAAAISSVVRIAFPIVVVGSMIYFISMIGAFL